LRFGNKETRKTKFSETEREQRRKNYRVTGDVEEARSAAEAVEIATCVGVRVFTKFLDIPLQSPSPTFCNPSRNSLCSSSVHGTPAILKYRHPKNQSNYTYP
jgi:hypothetical protein